MHVLRSFLAKYKCTWNITVAKTDSLESTGRSCSGQHSETVFHHRENMALHFM